LTDDPSRYRDQAELDVWRDRDPIKRLRGLLEREGWLNDEQAATVAQTADEVADRVRVGCLNTPDPDPESLFEHVYVEPHPLIIEQQKALRAERAAFETASEASTR
jgi:2-oxoisovalerate dehydrogenase E1 component alpha subunit